MRKISSVLFKENKLENRYIGIGFLIHLTYVLSINSVNKKTQCFFRKLQE